MKQTEKSEVESKMDDNKRKKTQRERKIEREIKRERNIKEHNASSVEADNGATMLAGAEQEHVREETMTVEEDVGQEGLHSAGSGNGVEGGRWWEEEEEEEDGGRRLK